MSTPIRLPLSPRQAAALDTALACLTANKRPPTISEVAALREVAGKLDTLREKS